MNLFKNVAETQNKLDLMGYFNLTYGRGDQRQMDKFIYNYVQLLQNLKNKIKPKLKMFKIRPTYCPGVGGPPPVSVSSETVQMQPKRSKLINVNFWPELTM